MDLVADRKVIVDFFNVVNEIFQRHRIEPSADFMLAALDTSEGHAHRQTILRGLKTIVNGPQSASVGEVGDFDVFLDNASSIILSAATNANLGFSGFEGYEHE
jgi:hypothetical protein